ncbi:MAG: hypothetical protein PHG08_00985 [Bacilli bacterium]|nr:hypothetical protein [Bacilli bacterium]
MMKSSNKPPFTLTREQIKVVGIISLILETYPLKFNGTDIICWELVDNHVMLDLINNLIVLSNHNLNPMKAISLAGLHTWYGLDIVILQDKEDYLKSKAESNAKQSKRKITELKPVKESNVFTFKPPSRPD